MGGDAVQAPLFQPFSFLHILALCVFYRRFPSKRVHSFFTHFTWLYLASDVNTST